MRKLITSSTEILDVRVTWERCDGCPGQEITPQTSRLLKTVYYDSKALSKEVAVDSAERVSSSCIYSCRARVWETTRATLIYNLKKRKKEGKKERVMMAGATITIPPPLKLEDLAR